MGMGRALIVGLVGAVIVIGAQPTATRASAAVADHLSANVAMSHVLDEGALSEPTPSSIRTLTFDSAALGRAMPYTVYLPPAYATTAKRYPVLYMLHGMSGTNAEWQGYGIFDRADAMIRAGELQPLIIVLPQGDTAYWVDHAVTDKEAWGRYMAHDVVNDVDARFRTIADSAHRAIGGVSMGAHGAVQLAFNYPGTFSVVGAHSLVLRRYEQAPAYFGLQADYAKRDPMQLAVAKTELLRSIDLWIDIGDKDQWVGLAKQFDNELNGLKVTHVWHEWSGDHSATYWSAHLGDYLHFYGNALAKRAVVPALPLN
ncbi:MAG TPA: alpha/beta hydrolase-fold protein [Methylomirabilota bacterium]|nr:alpha/beta hydrolase-fold protein [Methylomirabilota bacterium]